MAKKQVCIYPNNVYIPPIYEYVSTSMYICMHSFKVCVYVLLQGVRVAYICTCTFQCTQIKRT
jgi:hypothetical protein